MLVSPRGFEAMAMHHVRFVGRFVSLALAAVLAGTVGAGCVVDNVSAINLAVPDKTFSIDASRWRLDPTVTERYLATSCGAPQTCSAIANDTCKGGCSGTCNPDTSQCQLALEIRLYNAVDLVTERPELRTLPDQSVIHVGIDAVTYDVTQSSLNLATPELAVFVAPASVTDPNDPEATAIGTVASLRPGQTVTGATLALTAAGETALAAAMSSYKTPFNVLVAATVVIDAGDVLPSGKLDAVVHIRAHASL